MDSYIMVMSHAYPLLFFWKIYIIYIAKYLDKNYGLNAGVTRAEVEKNCGEKEVIVIAYGYVFMVKKLGVVLRVKAWR